MCTGMETKTPGSEKRSTEIRNTRWMRFQFNLINFINNYEPTKADNYRKNLVGDDHIPSQIDILDTAGEEDYPVVREHYYKKGEGFMFVFAVNDYESFVFLEEIHEQIVRVKQTTSIPFLLVGNKLDLEESRTVSITNSKDRAENWGCEYFECSAKTRVNVDEIFLNLYNMICKSKLNAEPTNAPPDVNPKRKCCCSLL